MYMHCFRSGEIVLSRAPDIDGAISLCEGPRDDLLQRLNAKAWLAYDGETWPVPSLPEAQTEDAAMDALNVFYGRVSH